MNAISLVQGDITTAHVDARLVTHALLRLAI